MKHLSLTKIPGTCNSRKIKKKQHLACLSVRNLQFFFSPFYTHLCNKLEFLRVRIRAHDKNDLCSRACAKKLMVSSLLSLSLYTRKEMSRFFWLSKYFCSFGIYLQCCLKNYRWCKLEKTIARNEISYFNKQYLLNPNI